MDYKNLDDCLKRLKQLATKNRKYKTQLRSLQKAYNNLRTKQRVGVKPAKPLTGIQIDDGKETYGG
jgi:hypothetical protein